MTQRRHSAIIKEHVGKTYRSGEKAESKEVKEAPINKQMEGAGKTN